MKKKTKLAAGLIHYPVLNKRGEVVTTSVIILDVHDMARLCRTYGAAALYVITLLKSQRRLIKRVMRHWTEGYAGKTNPSAFFRLGLYSPPYRLATMTAMK